jgi:hypothetical protein
MRMRRAFAGASSCISGVIESSESRGSTADDAQLVVARGATMQNAPKSVITHLLFERHAQVEGII